MNKLSQKMTTKNPVEKIARKRLSVLQLAESLSNVTEACRRGGMDRTSFYAWKKRFAEHGLEGLKDLPPIHKTHPQTTPEKTVKRLLEVSFDHPGWGCIKLSDYLKLEGHSISSPTAQKILIRNNMASKYERLMRLEEKNVEEGIELSVEQIRLIERMNPVFRERHVESGEPGELLCQDTKLVGYLSGFGKIYVQAVIDTYGSYGFACIFSSKRPEASVALLHNDVLPQYKEWGIDIQALLTDNGREYCGTDAHPYELYLQLNDIEHRRTKVRSPQTNGFVERFNRTLKEEFFLPALKKKIYTSMGELQEDLDKWLYHYNYERPHRGYRNMGKRPFETVKKFIKKDNKNVRHQG